MGLGGSWSAEPYSSAHVDEAAAAVDAALDAGITLFDHADIYRSGKAEAVFGEVLARTPGLRERIRLQTKCGIRLGEQGLEAYYDLSRDGILDRVNESLARLRTDYVDVLMLHRPDPLLDPAEVASAVGQLMAEGKVRAVGVSNMSAPQIELLQDRLEAPVVANQLEMSLLGAGLAGEHRAGQPRRGHRTTASRTAPWSTASGTASPCRPTGRLSRGLYTGAPAASPERRGGGHRGTRGRDGGGEGHHGRGRPAGLADEAPGRHRARDRHRQAGPDPGLRRRCRGGRGHDARRVVPALDHGPGQQHPLGPTGPPPSCPPNWLAVVVVMSAQNDNNCEPVGARGVILVVLVAPSRAYYLAAGGPGRLA